MTSAKKKDTIKVAERVAEQLRREIVTGNLRTGEKLLPEHQLQEKFGISRPTLREALRMLEAESLIHVARGRHGGASVTALDPSVLARQVGSSLQREGTTLRDVWIARMVFEPEAAGMVAALGSRAALEALTAELEASRKLVEDPTAFVAVTVHFSELLLEHCGNNTLRLIALLIEDIIRRLHQHPASYAGDAKFRQANIHRKEELLRLIELGDAEGAKKHWRAHLESTFALLSPFHVSMPIDVLRPPIDSGSTSAVTRLSAINGTSPSDEMRRLPTGVAG